MLLLAGVALFVQSVAGPPAMRRAWTVFGDGPPQVIGGRGDAVFFRTPYQIAAVNKRTGKLIWRIRKPGQWVSEATLAESRIVAEFSKAGRPELASLDLGTGAVLRTVPQAGRVSSLVSHGRRVYVLREGVRLEAYEETLKGRLWRQELATRPEYPSGGLAADERVVIAGITGRGTFALDAVSGRQLWMRPSTHPSNTPVLADGLVYLREYGSQVRDAITGEVKWNPPDYFDWLTVRNGVAFAEQDARIKGFDWKSGDLMWDRSGGTRVGTGKFRTHSSPSGDGVWIRSDRMRNFRGDGTEEWSLDFDLPAYADEEVWVTQEEFRIMGYVRGELPTIPPGESEREVLAQRLVREFEILDDHERELLVSLAPHGGAALLGRYADSAVRTAFGSRMPEPLSRGTLYGLGQRWLERIFHPEQTDALIEAITVVSQTEHGADLLNLMLKKGDPSRPIPYFLRKDGTWAAGSEETVARIIARSTHPKSLAFMRDTLLDPNGSPRLRRLAFRSLPTTGGKAGRVAVLRSRPRQATRGNWLKVEVLPSIVLPEQPAVIRKDTEGRTWGLFSSQRLGYAGDLFVAERQNGKWVKPLYLGTFAQYGDFGESSASFRGVSLSKFLKSEWIKMLPGDPSIRKDGDRDGLTDLTEVRLGLDPAKRDTDGDGVVDSIDLCPNARPRPLGDAEKIMRACVDTFSFGQPQQGPVVMVGAPGVEPFEIHRAGLPLLWLPFETRLFSDLYGPERVFFSGTPFRRDDREWLKLSVDGTRATTYLNTGLAEGSASVEVTLEKFEGEWFVMAMGKPHRYTLKQP